MLFLQLGLELKDLLSDHARVLLKRRILEGQDFYQKRVVHLHLAHFFLILFRIVQRTQLVYDEELELFVFLNLAEEVLLELLGLLVEVGAGTDEPEEAEGGSEDGVEQRGVRGVRLASLPLLHLLPD